MGAWSLNEYGPHRPTGSGTITRFVLLGVDVTCWKKYVTEDGIVKGYRF